jgi:hypothetical protein
MNETTRANDSSQHTHKCVERDYSSRIFDELARTIETGRRYRVLDLGQSFEQNINFFSQFSAHIQVEDLVAALHAGRDFSEALDEIKTLEGKKPFDFILCWDLLDHLTVEQSEKLFLVLANLSHADSKISLIHFKGKEKAIAPGQYKILNPKSLRYQITVERVTRHTDLFAQNVRAVQKQFIRERCYLLRHGVEEYLLKRPACPL